MDNGSNPWDLCYLEKGLSVLAPGDRVGGFEGRVHLRIRKKFDAPGQYMVAIYLMEV